MLEGGSKGEVLRRKVRGGVIEPAPNERALIIHYEVETTMRTPDGLSVVEKRPHEKRIRLKSFSKSSDIPGLARDVIERCKVLSTSKQPAVEEALHRLLRRDSSRVHDMGDTDWDMSADVESLRQSVARVLDEELEHERERMSSHSYAGLAPKDVYDAPSIDALDTYLELLYESIEEKVRATSMLQQLVRHLPNLEPIIAHTTLMGALARVFREDSKRSLDLSINIITIFFVISSFSHFHQVLVEHQVGNMTMAVVDFELRRTETLLQVEGPDALRVSSRLGRPPTAREAKSIVATRKQEKLLYLAFYLLLNLAEDVGIEKKMKKRNVVKQLCHMLQRKSIELLLVTLVFLKKLSIYAENKETMAEQEAVPKLVPFVGCRHEALSIAALKLLLNLSFDAKLRREMVGAGLIPRLVDALRSPSPAQQQSVASLLYHLSMDDREKPLFAATNIVPTLLEMVLDGPNSLCHVEALALMVNLCTHPRIAAIVCEAEGAKGGGPAEEEALETLAIRAIQMREPLMFKVLRTLALHEDVKPRFVPYIRELLCLAKAPECGPDLLLEVLGVLGQLACPAATPVFDQLVPEVDLLRFLAAHLQQGGVEDDILLEVVILTGTVCSETLAPAIATLGLVQRVCKIVTEKQEDEEMILQSVYALSQFLLHQPTTLDVLRNGQVIHQLVELLQDKNPELVKWADLVLDMVVAAEPALAPRVRLLKFASYNHEWMEITEPSGMDLGLSAVGPEGSEEEEEEEDEEDEEESQGEPSPGSPGSARWGGGGGEGGPFGEDGSAPNSPSYGYQFHRPDAFPRQADYR